MPFGQLHYFPLSAPLMVLLGFVLGLFALLFLGRVLRYAAEGVGLRPATLLLVLAASLIGSSINIPLAYLSARPLAAAAEVHYYGVTYVVPVMEHAPGTVLALNVGGALIPLALSLYLIFKHRMFALSLVGVTLVSAVCWLLARPVPGVGIALPIFVPPFATAVVALALTRRLAAPLAYVSGSLGPLIGADLLNLDQLQTLGAPVASIGGAGTFDGIFVTGLVALVYASILSRPPRHHAPRSA